MIEKFAITTHRLMFGHFMDLKNLICIQVQAAYSEILKVVEVIP